MPRDTDTSTLAATEPDMWIDRLDERVTRALDDLPHAGYVTAAVAAVGVALFLIFAMVVSSQVERGHQRGEREAALRSELWRCGAIADVMRADQCRQIARGETPASTLARWDELPPALPTAAATTATGIVPVSLSR